MAKKKSLKTFYVYDHNGKYFCPIDSDNMEKAESYVNANFPGYKVSKIKNTSLLKSE